MTHCIRFSLASRLHTAGVALLVVAACTPGVVQAQTQYFPGDPPAPFLTEDFEDQGAFYGAWTEEGTLTLNWGDWAASQVLCAGSDHWGDQSVQETGATAAAPGALLVNTSLREGGVFDPVNWENFRAEYDFLVSSASSQVGFVWAASEDLSGGGNGRDDGYLVTVEDAPNGAGAAAGLRARWHLYRRSSDTTIQVGSDLVELGSPELTIQQGRCYRLRLEWFCGNLRLSVRRYDFNSFGCGSGCYYGCDHPPDHLCELDGSNDSCWCTIAAWTDPTPLASGGTGIYSGATGAPHQSYFDNFSAASWLSGCTQVCTMWSTWDETWANAGEAKDQIPFKLLFEAGLEDQRQGYEQVGRIDAELPVATAAVAADYCSGWRLLVDLPPDPLSPVGVTENDIRKFLEPVASAVTYNDDGTWSDDFINDPANPSYNPIPLVPSGTTPIAAALMDAYDWYVQLRSTGGAWASDALKACRKWYVILITDGEESCAPPGPSGEPHQLDYACDPGQAASLFAAPENDLDPVPVYVIGFGVATTPAVSCVALNTGGEYRSASNAAELANTLINIFTRMEEEDRGFLPVAVSPSPTEIGGTTPAESLLLVPQFVPHNENSIWEGHLYAFAGYLPLDADGHLDITSPQMKWDAKQALHDQLAASPPTRWVYWPRFTGGNWTRVNLEDVPDDPDMADEFRLQLDRPAPPPSDAQIQEIVDFVVFKDLAQRDNRDSSDPVTHVVDLGELGDFFHSAPAIIAPPTFHVYQQAAIHDYAQFMADNAHRRRVVLLGGNDGLLHAFDGGFYDRDTTDYPGTFDLGTGTELFAVMPTGVVNKAYNMVYGTEQQYMVDGSVARADVYIHRPGESDPEWRSVAVAAMGQGGRSYLALDVTHPDPPDATWDPSLQFPGCLDGTALHCTGPYPRIMWEFTDTSDDDANTFPDLGCTWSAPVMGRVKRSTAPNELTVAFFGGGWDDTGANVTGSFFYAVDVETGAILYKENIATMLPGKVAALDQEPDGFVDFVYFGTTQGDIYRLDVSAPATLAGGRVTNWVLTKIYDFPDPPDPPDPLMFFAQPTLVPVRTVDGFDAWALALGSGNRADVGAWDGVVNRFYFVVDVGDDETRYESDLHAVQHDDPMADESFLHKSSNPRGWYLVLRQDEKVNTDALVVGGLVVFATFQPTAATAGDDDDDDDDQVCRAAGIGRLYRLGYTNANPPEPAGDDDDDNDDNDDGGVERGEDMGGLINGHTYNPPPPGATPPGTPADCTEELIVANMDATFDCSVLTLARGRVVTNWRQD